MNTTTTSGLSEAIEEGEAYLRDDPGIAPGSEEAFDHLCSVYASARLDSRSDTRLCLFTGAGASLAKHGRYDTPNWKDLLAEVYEVLGAFDEPLETLRALHPSPWDLAEHYEHVVGREKLLRVLRAVVQKWPGKDTGKAGRAYKRLPKKYLEIQWTLNAAVALCSTLTGIKVHPCYGPNLSKTAAVLTLNYDWYLEGAATQKYETSTQRALYPVSSRATLPPRSSLPVYHVHGYFPYDPERKLREDMRLILTTSDYVAAYGDPSSFLRSTLDSILTKHSTLFLGLSFDDEHLVARLRELARDGMPPHFALLAEEGLRVSPSDLRAAGVNPILYTDPGHKVIPTILGKVYERGLDPSRIETLKALEECVPDPERRGSAYWALLLSTKA